MKKNYLFIFGVCLLLSCTKENKRTTQFELLSPSVTGIDFVNRLHYNENFNVYTYRNYYNGGGVGIGDINNDGLVDIYFTANQAPNKLYLNKGNFKFEDITQSAGVGGTMGWSTGVSMADVNGDGWLDIYVCNSGEIPGDKKQNELFINNKDNTFSEQAQKFNLDSHGYSTHASFFDYDRDGDLDVYLLNNSFKAIGSFNQTNNVRNQRDSLGGDKLMRNNGGYFEDVSTEAGIYGSVIGFGLGVTVGDVNRDHWDDIYVSNDFFERDYLYINNQDGTFSEQLTTSMNSISGASMGADMADVNNDGYPDIFVTEMLPGDYSRLKSVTTFEDYDRYLNNIKNGYYYQFTRNTFQLNNTNDTFSEIGRMAGVEATDWSWGALIFDMNNDGLKDIFVANGVYQDLTNQDYLNHISKEDVARSIITNNKVDYKKLIEIIPSNPVSNRAFKNMGNLKFEDDTKNLGLDSLSFSNGAAYGDLDNDGDLDIVVNNVNMPCFVYKNHLMEESPKGHNYLKLILKGENNNPFATGTQITVKQGGYEYYLEVQPIRGFQSSMDNKPIIGLPDSSEVEVEITWPLGKVSKLSHIVPNQTLTVLEKEAKDIKKKKLLSPPNELFKYTVLNIVHREDDYVDFNRDRLKYHMQSTEGPKIAIGDIDNDSSEEFYLGGSKGNKGQLVYLSDNKVKIDSVTTLNDSGAEDLGSVFFDADNDGDLDLYVCTGGSEFSSSSSLLRDKLYFNHRGGLKLSDQLLPLSDRYISSSVAVPIDYDSDGDLDLFIGERLIPLQYGVPASGFLLQNDGKGNFKEAEKASEPFKDMGLITDAISVDIDGDEDEDIVVVGEYMGIHLMINDNGVFRREKTILSDLLGWWNVIHPVDIDGDGDTDFIVGNHGLNSRFKASREKPLVLVVDDFDKNGFIDAIISWTNSRGELYPFALKHNLAQQLKFVLSKFPEYKSFKDATLSEILGKENFDKAAKYQINHLASVLVKNEGNGKFSFKDLPLEAQLSPMYAIESYDFDHDGDEDIVMGGNLYAAKPEIGRYDASYGVYLENDGTGNFKTYKHNKGFFISGEVRDMSVINGKLYVFRNNDNVLQFEF